jgi:hypothetical protein
MDIAWKRAWSFPLWRLHSDHSHRSADQCPETPPEHQELSVAPALRTSVVTGNYLQINSPWPPARTRGFPLYSHRCCLGHLAETLGSKSFSLSAHDYCARYGVRAQSFTPGENDPFRRRRWLSSRRAEVARSSIGKKDRVCTVRGERRQYFLCIQHGAQESNISP